MSRTDILRALVVGALIALAVPRVADAQSAIDRVRFGIGLSMYGGDLDGNVGSDLPSYVGSSRLLAFAGVERPAGPIRVGFDLTFGQLRATSLSFDGTHSVFSADVTGSRAMYGPITLYAGFGPSLVLSNYDPSGGPGPGGEYSGGARFAMTFPIGVIIEDVVRIAIRLSATDRLDGFAGGSRRDVMGMLSIGYNFRVN